MKRITRSLGTLVIGLLFASSAALADDDDKVKIKETTTTTTTQMGTAAGRSQVEF